MKNHSVSNIVINKCNLLTYVFVVYFDNYGNILA